VRGGTIVRRRSAGRTLAGPARSILVALGEGTASDQALENAVSLARESGCRLTVMHVLSEQAAPCFGGYTAGLPACSEDYGLRLLERAVDAVDDRVPVNAVLRCGRIVDELLRRIEAAEHDVVVLGRRRPPLARLFAPAEVSVASLARSGARVVVAG